MSRTNGSNLLACYLVLPMLAAAPAASQVQSQEESRIEAVRLGLRSDAPQRVAEAAFDAVTSQLTVVSEDIAAALGRFRSTGTFTPAPWLLDAVVELKVAVPAATLERFWRQWPVQTALAFPYATGNRDEVLVRLLAESEGAAWFAAANLLVGHRVDGFAAELVKKVRFQVTVYVTDVPNMGNIGGGAGLGIGSTVGGQAPGFPPFVLYRFVPSVRNGARVLSEGPRTVHYQRELRGAGGWDEYGVYPPTNDEISKYLASVTKAAVGLTPLPERTQQSLLWENATQFQAEIDRIRSPLLDTYQKLVRSLVDAGVIKPADVLGAERAVTVTVEDHRRDRSIGLPSVQPAG